LEYFFSNEITDPDSLTVANEGQSPLVSFSKLDDNDLIVSIKEWQYHDDKVLSLISKGLINRQLFKVSIQSQPIDLTIIEETKQKVMKLYHLNEDELNYVVISDSVKNNAYSKNQDERINILCKNMTIEDIAVASDVSNISTLSRIVEKFFICHPPVIYSS
jgi:hypothetical protein